VQRRTFFATATALGALTTVRSTSAAVNPGYKNAQVHPYFEEDILETLFPMGTTHATIPDNNNGGTVNLLSYYISGYVTCVSYYGAICGYGYPGYVTRLRTNKGIIVARNNELCLSEISDTTYSFPQCVGLIKAVTTAYKPGTTTAGWRPGNYFSYNTPVFSVLATFSGNSYNHTHVCIYVGIDPVSGKAVVVEQNWPEKAGVRRRFVNMSQLTHMRIVEVPSDWDHLRNW